MTGFERTRRARARTAGVLLATALALVTSGCTSSPDDGEGDARPHSPTVSTEVVGELESVPAPTHAECIADPRPAPGVAGFHEIGGTGLYGLLFAEYPIKKRTEAKIAWRVAGSGPADIVAWGPDGRLVKPLWGPEAHPGSTWARPGSEWGTGFRFPSAGCWQIVVDTDGGTKTAAVRVV